MVPPTLTAEPAEANPPSPRLRRVTHLIRIHPRVNPWLSAKAGKIKLLSFLNSLVLSSSYGRAPANYRQALKLIQTKKLKVKELITHRLPLAETGQGFKLVAEAKESLKVIIEPQK